MEDPIVQSAVGTFLERSERKEDLSHLEATFADPGFTMRLANDNNEIVYGRRGTGKTHALKVLQHRATDSANNVPVYLDMRALGSNKLWEDAGRPASMRVTNLLRDVLKPVHGALLEYVTRPEVEPPASPFEPLERFAKALTESVMIDEKVATEDFQKDAAGRTSGAEIGVNAGSVPGLSVAIRSGEEDHTESAIKVLREGRPLERILFQELSQSLANALEAAGVRRLLLLLDEWTAVPADLQPLLAEFIKRVCFPIPRVTVKIAALEYRSVFGVPLDLNNVVGFELGADISAALELDDYFVFDRDDVGTLALFSELVLRHVGADCDSHWFQRELGKESDGVPPIAEIREILEKRWKKGRYLPSKYGIREPEAFVSAVFDDEETFKELVRAGEGVARDFMNIFKSAFFDAVRRKLNRIDKRAIRVSARNWFEQDKRQNIDEKQQIVLERIVNAVVTKRARSFLFEKEAEKSDMIRALFDLRLIHLVQRGYIDDPSKPGIKFNVYTLDFGTYVELLGTAHAPKGDFSVDLEDPEGVIVPFHDDRAIRRIVLPIDLLEPDEEDD